MNGPDAEASLWSKLAAEIETRIAAFEGVAGASCEDLTTGATVMVNADEVFPTASTIKIHILAHLLELEEQGTLELDQRVTIDHRGDYPGSGVLAYLDSDIELSRRDVASLMIIVSDNTATNMCIDWATYDGVNEMAARLGLSSTKLRRKMQDHESVAAGLENVSSPRDLVSFLGQLYRGEGLSKAVCAETLRIVRKPKHGYMTPALPEDLVVANKPGGMEFVRNDAGIVYLPRRPYTLCVMTKYGTTPHVVRERFISDLGEVVYGYMSMLDRSGPYGQGIPQPALGAGIAPAVGV
jgi:beta-lactamase class A